MPDFDKIRKANKSKEKEGQDETSNGRPERRASKMRFSWLRPRKQPSGSSTDGRGSPQVEEPKQNGDANRKEQLPPKKMPVFFIDEAHKL